jgi:hypothetical protein
VKGEMGHKICKEILKGGDAIDCNKLEEIFKYSAF